MATTVTGRTSGVRGVRRQWPRRTRPAAPARARTRDDLIAAVLAAGEFDGTDAAGAIREILDLDAYDEDDY
jgi:hypothetical protein